MSALPPGYRVFDMSVITNPTPVVKFRLDDSEQMRLEKVRSRLKLTEWTKIQEEYTLAEDRGVAKKMSALKTTNPLLFEDKYAFWSNRYTDFDVHWEKTRDDINQVVKAQLVATGRLRIDHLGKLAEGAKVVLMSGPTCGNPMPCTTVPPLRINHVFLDITFPHELEIENKHATNKISQKFRVGKNNCLFGTGEQSTNRKIFKDKQDIKRGLVSETMVTSIIKGVLKYGKEQENSEKLKKEENESTEQGGYEGESDHHTDDEEPTEATHQSWNKYPGREGFFQHSSNNGSSSRPYQQPFNRTSEMKDAVAMTSKMTIGKTNSAPTEETPHKNNESLDEDMAFNKVVIEPVLQESLAGLPQVGFILRPPGRVSL